MAKRKLEGEVQSLHADLDEMLNEAKNSEEKAKKAMVDAARWVNGRPENGWCCTEKGLYR